jgi:hypothetical protein
MAEFEHFDEAALPTRMLADGRRLPADFTPEETDTAQWLNGVFDIIGEDLPPYYARTLLGDPAQACVADDFEAATIATVFARLDLPRTPPPVSVPSPTPSWQDRLRWQAEHLLQRVAHKSVLATMALMMLLSYNALGTGVALASVLQVIVGRSGTQSVSKYPTQITLPAAQVADEDATHLNFTPLWPDVSTHGYTFVSMNALKGQWWTKGVLVTLNYEMTDGAGIHHMTILEFLPQTQWALQVVQAGAASTVQVGNDSGIFVWGQWTHQIQNGQQQMVWESSHRAELIYNGTGDNEPVVWIATDNLNNQSAPQMQAMLVDIANHLRPVTSRYRSLVSNVLASLSTELSASVNQPFKDDIIELIPGKNERVIYVNVGTANQIVQPTTRHDNAN